MPVVLSQNTYKGGPGYPNLEIQLNKEVVLIEWPTDPEQLVTVSCKDGTKYTANNVIVTVSLGVLKERYVIYVVNRINFSVLEFGFLSNGEWSSTSMSIGAH